MCPEIQIDRAMSRYVHFWMFLGFLLSSCATQPKANVVNQKTEIPFSYYEGSFMVVPIRINGGPSQDFILDTGIGVNLISRKLCEQLNCRIQGEHSGKRMSGQEVRISMSSVGSLALGNYELKDVPVGVFDLEAMMPGAKIAGFLSLGFFRDLPHTVDYKRQVITFENSATLDAIRADGIKVPVRFDIQGPAFGVFLPLTLPNGQQISAEVDTGSQSLILNERFAKTLGISLVGPAIRRKDGSDETGHRYTRYFTKLQGTIYLPQSKNIAQDNPDVMFQKIIYDGLVGHYFLSRFRVTYDLPRAEMIFRDP